MPPSLWGNDRAGREAGVSGPLQDRGQRLRARAPGLCPCSGMRSRPLKLGPLPSSSGKQGRAPWGGNPLVAWAGPLAPAQPCLGRGGPLSTFESP